MELKDIWQNPDKHTVGELLKLFDRDRDVFFVNSDGGVSELYFNPCAVSGAQFCISTWSADDILTAGRRYAFSPVDFFTELDDIAHHTCYDVTQETLGTGAFLAMRLMGMLGNPDFVGISESTVIGLVNKVGKIAHEMEAMA